MGVGAIGRPAERAAQQRLGALELLHLGEQHAEARERADVVGVEREHLIVELRRFLQAPRLVGAQARVEQLLRSLHFHDEILTHGRDAR